MVKRFEMSNLTCHDLVGSVMLKLANIRYDPKTCELAKVSVIVFINQNTFIFLYFRYFEDNPFNFIILIKFT